MAHAQATQRATQPEDVAHHVSAAERFDRDRSIEAGYSPWRHIGLTVAIATGITAIGAALAMRARPLDWVLAPIFFVVANFIEWLVHRYPMHRPMPPRFMYKNHAQLHHIAFTERNLAIGPARELGLVMMPWYTMIGLFVFASPVMVLAGVVRGPGLAGVFLLAAVAYFLMYETLHALYHVPDAKLDRMLLGRVGAFRKLQAHHRHHHVLKRMAHVNFNVTIPLMDHLLGTAEAPAPGEGAAPVTTPR